MWCDMRDRFRIRVFYFTVGFERSVEDAIAHRPDYTVKEFIRTYSSPSFTRLVDGLRKAERDKFWELFKDEYPLDTIIPNLGFKTKHRYSDDIVYVLDMGSWSNRVKHGIDPTRERLRIYKCSNTIDRYIQNIKMHGTMQDYLLRCIWHAKEQYVDNLTKKQREAILFIRMLPANHFVEGLGAHVGDTFILDC